MSRRWKSSFFDQNILDRVLSLNTTLVKAIRLAIREENAFTSPLNT